MNRFRVPIATATAALSLMAVGAPTASACTSTRAWAGWVGTWATSTGCGVIGSSYTRVGYKWSIAPGTNSRICVQGLGYEGKIGPYQYEWQRPRYAKWYSLGCGTSGGGTVPWGPVAAPKKVRATVQLGFLGGGYSWW